MELIKKKNKKKNNQQSEEEFYNINEIEDSDDSRNENYHNTVKRKECVLFQILKAKMK